MGLSEVAGRAGDESFGETQQNWGVVAVLFATYLCENPQLCDGRTKESRKLPHG